MYSKFSFLEKKEVNGKATYVFIASKEVVDRDGDLVRVEGIDTTNFEKNPVFLGFHNYKSFPIGKVVDLRKDGDTLYIEVDFADTDEGVKAKELVDGGYMKAVSIGFITKKIYGNMYSDKSEIEKDYPEWYAQKKDEIEKAERVFTEVELLEVSLVPVPANQDAVLIMASKGFKKAYTFTKNEEGREELLEIELPEVKNAVRYSEHPANMKKDEKRAWDRDWADMTLRKWASKDGSGEKEQMIWSKYRKGFGWYDANVIDNFTSYKFPHHFVEDGDFYVSFRGCVAGIVYLDRANIPAEDRKGVYNHLAKHYKEDFNREPPEFKEGGRDLIQAIKDYDEIHLEEYLKLINPDELKELVKEYEKEINILKEQINAVKKELEELSSKEEVSEGESKSETKSDVSPSDKEVEEKETSEEVEDLLIPEFSPDELKAVVKTLIKQISNQEEK